MSSSTVVCPRCNGDVEALQFIPPDILTKELMDSIDPDERSFAEKDDVEICTGCMDDLEEDISRGV